MAGLEQKNPSMLECFVVVVLKKIVSCLMPLSLLTEQVGLRG